MSKKQKQNQEMVTELKAILGRPVNPNSARQQKIAEREAKRAAGELKRGRPAVAGSKRQAVLVARAEKIANGGMLKRGRPVNVNSKRQQALAAKTVTVVNAGTVKNA